MFIGFFLRRIVTLTLCAGSFWLGMKADRYFVATSPAAQAAGDCPEGVHDN